MQRCLYGTCDAPQQWGRVAARALEALGVRRGRASAACLYHPAKDILGRACGDDVVLCGTDAGLGWVARELPKGSVLRAMEVRATRSRAMCTMCGA